MPEGEGKWRPEVENRDANAERQKNDSVVSGSTELETHKEKRPTTGRIARELEVDFETVKRAAELYRTAHPDWFEEKEVGRGKSVSYDPELVVKIRADIEARKHIPKGWKNVPLLEEQTGFGRRLIESVSADYRVAHPEWFGAFIQPKGSVSEYYHPDLASIVEKRLAERKTPPEGWETSNNIGVRHSVAPSVVRRIAKGYKDTNPEWFGLYHPTTGPAVDYLHPDLVKIIDAELDKRKKIPEGMLNASEVVEQFGSNAGYVRAAAEKIKATHPDWSSHFSGPVEYYHPNVVKELGELIQKREAPPTGWVSQNSIMVELKSNDHTIERILKPYKQSHPEWFGSFIGVTGQPTEYLDPLLAEIIREEHRRLIKAPAGWINRVQIAKAIGRSTFIVRQLLECFKKEIAANPGWFGKYRNKGGQELDFYSPEAIDFLRSKLPSEGWLPPSIISSKSSRSDYVVERIAERYRSEHPEWFGKYFYKSRLEEHYHPDLVSLLMPELAVTGEPRPEGWLTAGEISVPGEVVDKTLASWAERYRSEHPEWFGRFWFKGGLKDCYHPDLVEILRDESAKRAKIDSDPEREQKVRADFESFVIGLASGDSIDAKRFESLVVALGGSRALDILYKFRPEYKGLSPEYVKGVLADYLGDFLVRPTKFTLDGVEFVAEYLSELSFREGLFETLKDHCLQYYFERRRASPDRSSQDIIYDYLDEIVEKFQHLKNKELDDIIQEVIRYYDSVLKDFHKPEQFVESLDAKREFPDINQRINMKELAEKKRLLIADEMGLGKSASVIMAKEQIGARCALIVAPSNVVSTWKRYLSEESDGGYFKTGTAPKTLEVESLEDLVGAAASAYDYVLISQERLNERYSEALSALDYDMLVVDEIHKLKSLEGSRTGELMKLSEKVRGNDKYLAILSGTPAPNKVEDIAISLKLLYPEKFSAWDDRELVRQIINGDIVDLRSLLLPRMQAKKLEEGIEMPALREEVIETKLSPLEEDVYEVLLEDDELEATEKMSLLRKFLMNPDLLDATPGIRSAKVERFGAEVCNFFETGQKALVFVNGYIDGVMRGPDNIIDRLGLPKDVEVRLIHGDNRSERETIQQEFCETSGKMLLVVSGQTADVGVDFTSADRVFTYNEPWTEYDRRQQVSRVYRPGLAHDLDVRTFVTANTLEAGIHEYIRRKYQAIEKLLHGVPLQELEKRLLTEDEKNAASDLEVNPELAEYYFSSWDKLMRIFGYVKEMGEEDFKKFLSEYGKDYADCYLDLGNRSYQANANRVAGTMIGEMIKRSGGRPEDTLVLDVASGPEMLRQHSSDALRERVISVDANQYHLKAKQNEPVRSAVGSWKELPFKDKSFDYLNLALAFHYSNFVPSKGKFERLEVLKEANRVLKPGGRAVISLVYSLDFRDPSKFHLFAEKLGFKVIDEYSGEVSEGDEYRSRVITIEKVADYDSSPEAALETIDVTDYSGLKFKKTSARLKDQRNIIDSFSLNGRTLDVDFNAADKAVLEEEREMVGVGRSLKARFGGIANIPKDEVIANNFVRIKVGDKYLLFKKLEKGSGVVIVK